MQGVNPFILCNLAAKFTRKTFRPYGGTLEQALKANTKMAIAHLKSGDRDKQAAKNARSYELSFVPKHCEPSEFGSPCIPDSSE